MSTMGPKMSTMLYRSASGIMKGDNVNCSMGHKIDCSGREMHANGGTQVTRATKNEWVD